MFKNAKSHLGHVPVGVAFPNGVHVLDGVLEAGPTAAKILQFVPVLGAVVVGETRLAPETLQAHSLQKGEFFI